MKTKESLFYIIIRPIITFLFKLLYNPKIIGKENIPKTGKIIIAGNHTHIFDCLSLMSSTKREIHFLAKKELFTGLKRIIFNNLGLIPVDRQTKSPKSLSQAIEYLNDNKVIGIFPEGTTKKKKGELLPFKFGAVSMAKKTKTPIVPCAITGSYKLRSKDLTIRYDKPLKITEDNLEEANNKLYHKINALIEENLIEKVLEK